MEVLFASPQSIWLPCSALSMVFTVMKRQRSLYDKIDIKTGLLRILHGKYRKPVPNACRLGRPAIDLQDVGVRCYTHASCMRLVMEACFEGGVEVVLDRPNPLGDEVGGAMMDEECMSSRGHFRCLSCMG